MPIRRLKLKFDFFTVGLQKNCLGYYKFKGLSVHGKEEIKEMVLGGDSKVEVLWEGVRP